MYCKNCGAAAEDGATHCSRCGARLDFAASPEDAPKDGAFGFGTAPKDDLSSKETFASGFGATPSDPPPVYGSAPAYGSAPGETASQQQGSPRLIYDESIGGYRPLRPDEAARAGYTAPAAPAPSAGSNSAQTFGIVSLVLTLLGFGLIGFILGIVAIVQGKAVGNGTAKGLGIASVVINVLSVVLVIAVVLLLPVLSTV